MSEPGSPEHQPGGAVDQRRKHWPAVAVTGALVVAVVVGLAFALRPGRTDQPSKETDRAGASTWDAPPPTGPAPADGTIGCSWAGPLGDSDPTYCQRVVADGVRRARLTAQQRADAGARAGAVKQAVHQRGELCAPMTAQCAAEQARQRHFPAPSAGRTADDVRRALEEAGFAGAVVRPAGPADPAPRTAIVYAVPTGGACLVGYVPTSGSGGGDPLPLGTLPGGRCLA